ncbi:MAG: hypothetical protein EPO68_04965 [Planctomycetota bacterium]|nr:MAG: hypothetical protein EPO68_04965 [Planctomycetota bacterium]
MSTLSFLLSALALLALLAPPARARPSELPPTARAPRSSLAPTEFGWAFDGYKLAPAPAARILDVLAAHDDGAAVLASLVDTGADPASIAWSSLGSFTPQEAARLDPALLPVRDQFVALRDGINAIFAPVDLAVLELEVWLGFRGTSEGPADQVALLVATFAGGETRLVYGRHDHYANGSTRVLEFDGAFVDEAAADDLVSPIAGPKWIKVKDKWAKFKQCFKNCLMISAPPLTALQVICLTFSAVACIPATGGWPACFTAAAAACGLGLLGVQVTFCGIYALSC